MRISFLTRYVSTRPRRLEGSFPHCPYQENKATVKQDLESMFALTPFHVDRLRQCHHTFDAK